MLDKGHVDVPGDTRYVTIIGDNVGGEVDKFEHMEASVMQLEVVHERLCGDFSVYGIGMMEISDPCVLNSVDDEVAATAFGGFMDLEIMTQQLLVDLGLGADNRSGLVWDIWVDNGMCGRK